ncbi:unnamed protein product [Arabidopsis thaliana]|uniref:(thale cress) hypothetical protein n=1 Tax=Arabidopsis thaliana TaxID=3702 RepID=A0A7G2EKG9_ARATH|nr:unnamed protein product [Arabidopsis thaliana]
MLHLASAFLSRGFSPVVMTPESIHRRISATNEDLGITFLALSDGQDRPDAPPSDFFSIENSMENIMPPQLERLLLEEDLDVACVVVDLLASWAIGVADRCGVPVAGFWPVMFAAYRLIQAIPELVRTGLVSQKGCPRQLEKTIVQPEQPLLSAEDLPWLIGTPKAQKKRFKFWQRTLERTKSLRPLHNQEATNNITITKTSFWEEDMSCLGESNIQTLALALEASGRPFLWALNRVWQEGLPPVASSRRLLCYPVAGDQFVNCKYIVDVWKIGVRLSGFGEKEVEDGLRKVMEDQDMGERLRKLRDRAMGNEARLSSEMNFTFLKNELN